MKKHYNILVRRYYRYQRKLNRIRSGSLFVSGTKNETWLVKKLEQLFEKLNQLKKQIALVSVLTFVSAAASAQITLTPQTGASNPMNGFAVNTYSNHDFADLDNDGDLDLISGEYYGVFHYYENTGTAVSPVYTEIIGAGNPMNGFNIGDNNAPQFVDLDGDGDFDLMVGDYTGDFFYFENIGTAASPNFIQVIGADNPMNGQTLSGGYGNFSFADLDGDGDFDLISGGGYSGDFYYFENTGTATSPNFVQITGAGNPMNAYGNFTISSAVTAEFADFDNDGDFDLISGSNNGQFHYFENTGTATSPNFVQITGAGNPMNGYAIGMESRPEFVDLDNDGDFDLMAGNVTGVFYYFKNPAPAPPMGTVAQIFCSIDGSTIADLSITGANIQWYAVTNGGTALVSTTVLVGGTYYASQTVGGIESVTRLEVTVTVSDPASPTGTAAQTFCSIDNPTVADLLATGTSIQWYAATTGGTALASTTLLVDATTYYASQTVSGCESDTRLAVATTVSDPASPTGTATQNFCSIDNPTIADLLATGTSIQWYAATTGGTALASTTLLADGTTYYASQTVSGCESDTRLAVATTVSDPASPTGTATQNFCSIDNPTVANLLATGTGIQWYTAATGGTALASTTSLADGTTYYASQTVNGCESDTRLSITVSIQVTPSAGITTDFSICTSSTVTLEELDASLSGADIGGVWTPALAGGGIYTYTVSATSPCTTDATATVVVNTDNTVCPDGQDVVVPQGFSPNNDGINDFFEVGGIKNYESNSVSIFSRWGSPVFSASPYENNWDGKNHKGISIGSDLPEGTYFYIINLGDDGKVIKGYIYLKR